MNKDILISVCIPVYNSKDTLRQAIWSVLNQSFESFELLLYLDGCTDNSEEIIDSFDDNRIRKIVNVKNEGIVHARNELIQQSKGNYLAWLDSDDIALPSRLMNQFQYLENNLDIFGVGSWVEVRGYKRIKFVKWSHQSSQLNSWILFRNPLVQSALMFRNDKKILVYNKDFEYLEDYELLSKIWRSGKKVGMVNEVLTSYLQPSEKNLIDKYLKYDFVGKLEGIMKVNFREIGYEFQSFELALFREFLRSNMELKLKNAKLVLATLNGIGKAIINSDMTGKRAYKLIVHYEKMRLFKCCKKMRLRIFLIAIMKPYLTVSAWRSRPRFMKA